MIGDRWYRGRRIDSGAGQSSPDHLTRRGFLARTSCLCAGLIVSGNRLLAQSKPAARRIDVHHHFVPDAYLSFAKGHGSNPIALQWSLANDLADMDQNGTATAIVSITTPGFDFGTIEEVRKVTRQCNEAAARLSSDHPGRFGSFASLWLKDIDGALMETAYALDRLKADGVGVFSNYGDKWLGNASFAPLYEELDRRKAIVFVHPATPSCCINMSLVQDGVPNEGPMIEYGTDTTRTIASLVFSGTTRRFPNITWIFSHGGGVLPYLIERLFQSGTSAEVVPGIVTKGQDFPTYKNILNGEDLLREIRRMYYDTAQTSNPIAMAALRNVVPVSQILFGTDYWYRTAAETYRALEQGRVFSDDELRAVNRLNAERILPRLARAS